MAIDPRSFIAAPFGSISNASNQNRVKRSQDLLRNSRSIFDTPNIVKRQVNATINRTVKRIPGRISQAANNIAINSVTSIAFGAFDRFRAGEGLAGIVTGSVSDGFGAGVDGLFGATDQILGQVGSDAAGALGGIVNNVGGGVLSGVAAPVIAGLQNLDASTLVTTLGDAGSNIAGLFGGNGDLPDSAGLFDSIGDAFSGLGDSISDFFSTDPDKPADVASLPFIDENTRKGVYDLIGVPQSKIANCPQATQDMWNNIADSIAYDIVDPKTPLPKGDITAFGDNVAEGVKECAIIQDEVDYDLHPKHYASNLSFGGYQPKYKFLFMVEFIFHPEYQQLLNVKGREKAGLEFVVKNSTRPHVAFEYEEVNMYNYWTKIPKRTMYEPMTMRFYDDDANNANSFYTQYLRAMSPIANEGGADAIIFPQQYQENSLSPSPISRTGQVNSLSGGASLGALNNDAVTILSEIRLYHLFDWGKLLNVYHMYNPKITNMNPDDVDMAESGAGNELELQFVYDGLFVEPNRKATKALMAKISGATVGAGFEIEPIFDNDENDAMGDDKIEEGVIINNLNNQGSSAITPSFEFQTLDSSAASTNSPPPRVA